MKRAQLKELLLQALEHERGGVLIYQTALECVVNKSVRKEWEKYLSQTKEHVELLSGACVDLGVDPAEKIPSLAVVQHMGKSLVQAMKLALAAGDPAAAELVACDCVVLAETKDHMNWGLIGECVEALKDNPAASSLAAAYAQVEDEEDEHLYHSKGWGRELWIKALGMPAVLPPAEEERHVHTAVGAAKAARETQRAHATR